MRLLYGCHAKPKAFLLLISLTGVGSVQSSDIELIYYVLLVVGILQFARVHMMTPKQPLLG